MSCFLSYTDDEQGMRERRNSFVGTAQYISPELLKDKSASYSSDLWALGCIVYQMLAGSPPFQSRSEYIIFQKIQKLEYEFPENFDSVGRDLVEKLLVLDPTERLGASDAEGRLPQGAFFFEVPEKTYSFFSFSLSSQTDLLHLISREDNLSISFQPF